MQEPFVHSAVDQKNTRDCSFARWESSVLAVVGAVMLFMAGSALVNPPSANDIAARDHQVAFSELSAAMPLP